MRKTFLFFCLSIACVLFSAQDIQGFWKTVNEEGVAQCIIAIYPYEDLYYGRIIATFGEKGKIDDSIYHPVKKTTALVGDPYYSGLDIIWWLEDSGMKFKGKILDPEKGNVYNSELWIEGDNLIVRGKLLFFGRSQEWLPVVASDLPKNFKLPDMKTFVPVIPEKN